MSRGPLLIWDGSNWAPKAPTPSGRTNAVGATASTTTLSISPTSVNGSGTITLTALVDGGAVTTGTVAFDYLSGSTWVEFAQDTAGAPYTTTRAISADTTFRARFLGNASKFASTSGSVTAQAKVLTTYVKTYACAGTGTYSGGGSKRTDTSHMFQGYYDGTWDTQKSVAVFGTAMQSDLVGAYDITKVEVYLNALHWGPGDGGTAVLHTINNSSVPSTWGGVASLSAADNTAWTTKTGAKWCDISSLKGVPSDWTSGGTKKGIALYINSTSNEYYGYMAGNGESGEPQLRITYRKYV